MTANTVAIPAVHRTRLNTPALGEDMRSDYACAEPRRRRLMPQPASTAAMTVMIKNHGSRANELRSSITRHACSTAMRAKSVAVVTRYAFIEPSGRVASAFGVNREWDNRPSPAQLEPRRVGVDDGKGEHQRLHVLTGSRGRSHAEYVA